MCHNLDYGTSTDILPWGTPKGNCHNRLQKAPKDILPWVVAHQPTPHACIFNKCIKNTVGVQLTTHCLADIIWASKAHWVPHTN